MLGDATISDLLDKWIENGETEFVPGAVTAGAPADFLSLHGGYASVHGGQRASATGRNKPAMHNTRGQPLPPQMAAAYGMGLPHPQYGMVQGAWVPVGPGMPPEGVVPGWHVPGAGLMYGLGSHMLQQGSASAQPKTIAAKVNTYVAAWNLKEDYTEELLQQQLLDIDFHPNDIWACQGISGAFILQFADSWHANALIVSLDGTSEHLSPCTGEMLRLAKWTVEPPQWGAEDVPPELQRAAEAQGLAHLDLWRAS